jgi:hypothetical protein
VTGLHSEGGENMEAVSIIIGFFALLRVIRIISMIVRGIENARLERDFYRHYLYSRDPSMLYWVSSEQPYQVCQKHGPSCVSRWGICGLRDSNQSSTKEQERI